MLGFGHSSRQGAKTPSSERKTLCHFDRREKSFLDPSHLLGMTDLGPLPLRLGVFAGDNPISASAFFAPSAVNDPGPNHLWLRLCCAKFFAANIPLRILFGCGFVALNSLRLKQFSAAA